VASPGLLLAAARRARAVAELDLAERLARAAWSQGGGVLAGLTLGEIITTAGHFALAEELYDDLQAELMAGVDVESVIVGIAGDHIRAINSKGVVAISRDDNEITELDVVRAIDAAKAVSIPMDREILHVIPQEFVVDEQKGIKDPIGMCGVRLETQVHIITGAVTSASNSRRRQRSAPSRNQASVARAAAGEPGASASASGSARGLWSRKRPTVSGPE